MNLKLTTLLLVPAVAMLQLAGCGDSQPSPDIEATVEARAAKEQAIQDYDEAIRLNPQLRLGLLQQGCCVRGHR